MDFNRENMKKIFCIILFAGAVFWGAGNVSTLRDILSYILGVVFPFILGGCIAFILNVPMRFIESTFFDKYGGRHIKLVKKIKRPVSFILTLLFVISLVFIIFFLIIPQIGETIKSIGAKLPDFMTSVEAWVQDLIDQYGGVAGQIFNQDFNWNELGSKAADIVQTGISNFVNSTVGVASSIISGVVSFFLGLVFSIYVLMQKEKLGRQVKCLMYAYLPQEGVDKILTVGGLANKTFSKFLSGQCLEACILGSLFFITLLIFSMPYALLISVLIAFTALIPVVGSFIGCGVGAFLILMISPVKAFWFIVLFLVLQQVEGNLVYPRVVGSSIGLPSIWVLVAVTVGGSVMGIFGMLLFIPLVSVIYALIREHMYKRLSNKKISQKKWS